MIFVASLGNRPQGARAMYSGSFILFATIMVMMLYVSIFQIHLAIANVVGESQVVQPDGTVVTSFPTLGKLIAESESFRVLVLSVLSTVGVYIVSSMLFLDPWHIITSFVQYLLLVPSFVNILMVYAFCNLHDVSWGTKGDNRPEEIAEVKVQKNASGVQVATVTLPADQYDIDETYSLFFKELGRAPEKQDRKVQSQEDYFKIFRTRVVLLWVFSNILLVAAMITPETAIFFGIDVNDSTKFNPFLTFYLWSVAAMGFYRLIGCIYYKVEESPNLKLKIILTGKMLRSISQMISSQNGPNVATDNEAFFQSDRDIIISEQKKKKQSELGKVGDPVKFPSKILHFDIVDSTIFTSHSGFIAQAIPFPSERELPDIKDVKNTTATTFQGHQGPVTYSCVAPPYLFTSSWDKTIKQWDLETQQLLQTFSEHLDFVKCVKLHNRKLYSCSTDKTIICWDLQGNVLGKFIGHTRAVEEILIHDGFLYSCSSDTTVKKWDLETYQDLFTFNGHLTSVYGLHISEDSLWSVSGDKFAIGWDLETGGVSTRLEHPDYVKSIVVLPNGLVATGCRDENIRIWDPATEKVLYVLSAHFDEVSCLKVHKGYLISSSLDGTLRFWNLKSVLNGTPEEEKNVDPVQESLLTAEEEAELAELMGLDGLESDVELSGCEEEILEESAPVKTGIFSSVLLKANLQQTVNFKSSSNSIRNSHSTKFTKSKASMSAEEGKKCEAEMLNNIFSKSIMKKQNVAGNDCEYRVSGIHSAHSILPYEFKTGSRKAPISVSSKVPPTKGFSKPSVAKGMKLPPSTGLENSRKLEPKSRLLYSDESKSISNLYRRPILPKEPLTLKQSEDDPSGKISPAYPTKKDKIAPEKDFFDLSIDSIPVSTLNPKSNKYEFNGTSKSFNTRQQKRSSMEQEESPNKKQKKSPNANSKPNIKVDSKIENADLQASTACKIQIASIALNSKSTGLIPEKSPSMNEGAPPGIDNPLLKYQFSSSHKFMESLPQSQIETFWNDRDVPSKGSVETIIDDLHPDSIARGIKPLTKLPTIKYQSLPNGLDCTGILDTLSIYHFLWEFSELLFNDQCPFGTYGTEILIADEFMSAICHPEIHFVPILTMYKYILEFLEGKPIKHLCDVHYSLCNFYDKHFGVSDVLVELRTKEFYMFYPDTHVAILTGLIDTYLLGHLETRVIKVKTDLQVNNQIFQSHYVKYKLCRFLLLNIQNQGFNLKNLEAISPLIMNEVRLKVEPPVDPVEIPASPSSVPSTPSTVDLTDSDEEMKQDQEVKRNTPEIAFETKQKEITDILQQSLKEYLKSSELYEKNIQGNRKILKEFHLESKKFLLGTDRYGYAYWFIPLNFHTGANPVSEPIFGIIKEHSYSDSDKPPKFSTIKDFKGLQELLGSLFTTGARETKLSSNIYNSLSQLNLGFSLLNPAEPHVITVVDNAFAKFNLWIKKVYTIKSLKNTESLSLTPFDLYFGPIMKTLIIEIGEYLGLNQYMKNAVMIIQNFPFVYYKKLLLKWHANYKIFDILPPSLIDDFQNLDSISYFANWCSAVFKIAKQNRRRNSVKVDIPGLIFEPTKLQQYNAAQQTAAVDMKEYFKMKLAAFALRN
ncbi:Chitin synthase, class 1 [Terramyces sp. JEL0728]|nr:Chitin synthase, class 1 [Terramyces sp. JEL0728]